MTGEARDHAVDRAVDRAVGGSADGATGCGTGGPVGLDVVDLVADYGGARVVREVSFHVGSSELVTLLGPSGCGKTTTLRCVAGLHPARGGTISVGGDVVAGPGVHVRPERRRINMVFQSYAIWPHMSVFDNVAYGLRTARTDRRGTTARVHELLELVGLADFAGRPATGLSGGQQQRVALARALATRPRVLLLDEPLSNLDAVLRARMRGEIMRIQRETGTTTLYVTHDRREALSMSHRIVVLRDGVVEQVGTPQDLYDRPVSRFVAEFLGSANVLPATVTAVDGSGVAVTVPGLDGGPTLRVAGRADRSARDGQAVALVIRPEALVVSEPSAPNSFPARMVSREFLGNRSELSFLSGQMSLRGEADRAVTVGPDGAVTLSVRPELLTWVPAE